MDTQLILKIGGIGILIAVTCQVLIRSGRDEQAMLLSVAGIVIVLLLIIDKIGSLIQSVKSIFGI